MRGSARDEERELRKERKRPVRERVVGIGCGGASGRDKREETGKKEKEKTTAMCTLAT